MLVSTHYYLSPAGAHSLDVSGDVACSGKFRGDGSLLTGISGGGGGGGGGSVSVPLLLGSLSCATAQTYGA